MNTKFMNSENSKISESHRLILQVKETPRWTHFCRFAID